MGATNAGVSALGQRLREDLKVKHRLLSAACKCLEDEACYRFFDVLARLSRLPDPVKDSYLTDLGISGEYETEEMAALRRLVMEDGAQSFKQLVDVVRDIRVKQEIEQIVVFSHPGGRTHGLLGWELFGNATQTGRCL